MIKLTRRQLAGLIRKALNESVEDISPEEREQLRTMGHDPVMASSALDLGLALADEDFNMDSFKQQIYERAVDIYTRNSRRSFPDTEKVLLDGFRENVTGEDLASVLPELRNEVARIINDIVKRDTSSEGKLHPDFLAGKVQSGYFYNAKEAYQRAQNVIDELEKFVADPMAILGTFIASIILKHRRSRRHGPLTFQRYLRLPLDAVAQRRVISMMNIVIGEVDPDLSLYHIPDEYYSYYGEKPGDHFGIQ